MHCTACISKRIILAALPCLTRAGTNDCHRLLPLQVYQADPGEMHLQATNGKMLDIILKNPGYSTLSHVRCGPE